MERSHPSGNAVTREMADAVSRGTVSATDVLAVIGGGADSPPPLRLAPPPATQREREKEKPWPSLQEIQQELSGLVGLASIRSLVEEIYAFVTVQRERKEAQLRAEPMVLHMVFRGNPGTGKTTVARRLAGVFRRLEVLPKGHLIEVERADLVGEYIGHTAQKTREQVRRALGGILFVDEAYSLARGGDKDFGREAIDALVKAMEDEKEHFVLILAGYRREMERFLLTNPGLKSRFPMHLDFPDYTPEELISIAEQMLRERDYRLGADAKVRLATYLRLQREWEEEGGNARYIRNLIERAIRRQAVRLLGRSGRSREDLLQIEAADLELPKTNSD